MLMTKAERRRWLEGKPVDDGPLIDRREVEALAGIRRSQIDELMAAGKFPRPIKRSRNTRLWRQAEVERWIAAKGR